jgi:Bacterial Ig-like domain (group 3)
MSHRWGARRFWSAAVLALSVVWASWGLAGLAQAATPSPPPTVTGVPEQGKTLTTNPVSNKTVWRRCSSTGAQCSPISTAAAYTLVGADVGETIRAKRPNTPVSDSTAVVFPILLSPGITGSTAEGQTLTANPNNWSVMPAPPGASFSYSWSRCTDVGTGCVPIQGAAGQQYQLSSADVGHVISVAVSDTEPSGAGQGPRSASTTSPVTAVGAASTTSLVTSPSSGTTNQLVTLIATVTSANSTVPPNGTVAFSNGGTAIPGCGAVPASGPDQSVTLTCPTTFPAASSPEQLTAVFTPSAGSPVSGSGSSPVSLTIRKDSTISSVDVSSPTVALGSPETYTANFQGVVGGSAKPSGTAEFVDNGAPIAGCTDSPLTATIVGAQASCVVRYTRPGSHSVSVSYPGDANYLGSASQAATQVNARLISLGAISSTMQWTFRVTRSYTRVLGLLINSVSAGTDLVVRCHGQGCPFAKRASTIRQSTRCPTKGKCTTHRSRNVDLKSEFRRRRLRKGAQIAIFLTRPQWIGKYYQFTIRAGAPPRIRIACLAPGSTAPGVGC